MNIIKASQVTNQLNAVRKIPKGFSSMHSLVVVASIALFLLVALLSVSEPTASEARFDAKLKNAAAAVDSGFSDVQKFFPASFR